MIDDLLGDAETMAALRALRPDGDAAEEIARVAWSILAEPGDGVAGALIARARCGGGAPLRARRLFWHRTGGAVPSMRTVRSAEARARWRPRADSAAVGDALRGATHVGAAVLVPGDAEWPTALDELGDHTPSVLWVRGDSSLLTAQPRVAIVGARASTGYGEHLAAELAGDLAADGAVIVSGGAYGIDGAAHRAALGVGGATVAFLAGGVDRAYPSGHRQLLGSIARFGAVVSELPCGAAPTKWRFLAQKSTDRCARPGDGRRGGRVAQRVAEHGWACGVARSSAGRRSWPCDLGGVSGLSSVATRVRRPVRHVGRRDPRAVGSGCGVAGDSHSSRPRSDPSRGRAEHPSGPVAPRISPPGRG